MKNREELIDTWIRDRQVKKLIKEGERLIVLEPIKDQYGIKLKWNGYNIEYINWWYQSNIITRKTNYMNIGNVNDWMHQCTSTNILISFIKSELTYLKTHQYTPFNFKNKLAIGLEFVKNKMVKYKRRFSLGTVISLLGLWIAWSEKIKS